MITVAELIEELQQYKPEAEVCGCPCGEELNVYGKGTVPIGTIKLREEF